MRRCIERHSLRMKRSRAAASIGPVYALARVAAGSRKLGLPTPGDFMKLGLAVEYAGKGVDIPIDLIKRCEAMGYDSVWTAEAYGSDAITPLAYIAAHTKKIRLGTGVLQLSARTPAAHWKRRRRHPIAHVLNPQLADRRYLAQQLLSDRRQLRGRSERRLGHEIHGAEFQSLEDVFVSRASTDHENRSRSRRHEQPQKGKAVHPRHLQIHEHRVEATRRIRQMGSFDSLPIIAMTAHVMHEELQKCLVAGINDHTTKPIDPIAKFHPVDLVIVANQKATGQIERTGFYDLLGRPLRSWMSGQVEMKDSPPLKAHDEEYVENAERRRRHDGEIGCKNVAHRCREPAGAGRFGI